MKMFEDPKMEVLKFAVNDVIATSTTCADDCDDDLVMLGDCI